MDFLKTLWPTPFKIKPKDVTSFIVQLIIFALIIIVASILIGVLRAIPIVGWVFGIVGGLIDLYSLIGVILCICKFLDVLK
jgi:hypothetical protein